MSESFLVRRATPADLDIIVNHRMGMFRDMGALPPDAEDALRSAALERLREALPRGAYLGWLASLAAEPDRVVAGAGVQRRRVLPFPRRLPDGRTVIAEGRQAIVLNVYTEPAFRRRGLARALMHQVLSWARQTGIESLVLHAAPDGKPLYQQLGFTQTNEMRFTGDLATWIPPVEPG